MENKETQETLKALFEEDSLADYPAFQSKEDMKTYYMQMSRLLTTTPPSGDPESDLKRLRRKLRQFIHILSQLNNHEWGEGVGDIQTACAGFLLLKDEEFGRKKEVNKSISKHFEFIIRISQNIYLLRQLQGLVYTHSRNVTLLINEIEKEKG